MTRPIHAIGQRVRDLQRTSRGALNGEVGAPKKLLFTVARIGVGKQRKGEKLIGTREYHDILDHRTAAVVAMARS